MLNNKKFNIVISLIIAIGLWAYVIGETNPPDTKTFRDIPIQLINESVLEDNGLAIKSVSAESLNLTLTGSRAGISQVDLSDISATVDLADAAEGDNQLKITIRIPEGVELEDKSLNKVTVSVEKRVSKEMDIVPEYEGSFSAEEEPITIEMSRDKVTVTGAESLIEKVDHVCAKVGAGEVSDEMKTIGSTLIPVDAEGTEIKRIELSAKTVQITAELASVKTVALQVPVTDDSDGLDEKAVTVPKTITIKGKSSVLASIEEITAEPIDITEIEEDTTVAVVPILPSGVQVSEKSEGLLVAKITVTKAEQKSFSFNSDEIDLTGLDADLEAEVRGADSIEVVISGAADALAKIEKGDITLSADLTGLEEGTHQVVLLVSCGKEYTALTVEPEEIRVIIK